MANRNENQQGGNSPRKVSNTTNNKGRKADTGRTSDGGRKAASGGSTNTNNRGHQKGV